MLLLDSRGWGGVLVLDSDMVAWGLLVGGGGGSWLVLDNGTAKWLGSGWVKWDDKGTGS